MNSYGKLTSGVDVNQQNLFYENNLTSREGLTSSDLLHLGLQNPGQAKNLTN